MAQESLNAILIKIRRSEAGREIFTYMFVTIMLIKDA